MPEAAGTAPGFVDEEQRLRLIRMADLECEREREDVALIRELKAALARPGPTR